MSFIFKRQPATRRIELSLTSVIEQQIDIVDEDGDPFNVLVRRTELIAFELNISEEEAERLAMQFF